MSVFSRIRGVGGYLPQNRISNDQLPATLETSDEWITTRTGIKSRHIATAGESTATMAAHAARKALQNAKIEPTELDGIILATTSPDYSFPATATKVQAIIGAENAWAFDIQAVCAGFVFAMVQANNFITSGQAKNILVIGADTMSSLVDWKDRSTAVLFGDGAGAVVLSAADQPKKCGVLAFHIASDGRLNDILITDGGISTTKTSGLLRMNGREVFKHAVEKMSASLLHVCNKAGLGTKEIDWLIPHQANARIIKAIAERINFPEEKTVLTVAHQANTSAATIPLALAELEASGKLERGQLLAFTALGAGLSWGSMLIYW